MGYTSCVYVLCYVHMSWVTSYILGDDHMSWVTCYTSWITPTEHMLPKRYACNSRGIPVTQEVYMQTKSLICHLYILGNMHMSWVTAYTSWITFSSHELPKRYACNPRGMYVTQEVYTSWVYLLGIPLGLLSIPLGLLSIPLG